MLEQTRIIAANYKTIDKETKDFCLTVSGMLKQRHSLLITNEMLLQEAKAFQPKKNKNPSGKLMQREVSSKKSRVATTKTSGDTEIHHATKTKTDDVTEPSAPPTTWVDQSTMTSNLLTLSQAFIDTLHCSTIPDDPKKKEWNHVPNNNICLPFVNNHLPIQVSQYSVDYLDSQRTDNHRTAHEIDVLSNSDSNRMMAEYRRNFQRITTNHVNQSGMMLASGKSPTDSLGTFYCSARTDPKNEMFCLPFSIEYNDVLRTANDRIQEMKNTADMMRMKIMALTYEEEEETSRMNNFPGAPPFHVPYCQPIQDDGGGGMVLWHPAIDSSHHGSLSSAEDEGVSTAYKTEEFPIDDSFLLSESLDDEEDSADILLGEDIQF
jgi:hypothetical protein